MRGLRSVRHSESRSSSRKVGYLCGMYPAISHTFVYREVVALRRRGVEVSTFSIHRPGPEQLLSLGDREAFETTYAVLPPSWPRLVSAHFRLALTAPRAYLSTLRFALGLAPPGLRGRLWQFFYLTEAVLLWDECRRQGVRHLHVHLAGNAADAALLVAHLGNAVEGASARWSWSFTMHGPTELFDVSRFRLAEKIGLAEFVVCISDFTRSQLMSLTDPAEWSKLHVVRSSVDSEHFRASGNGNRRDAPEILCIGRLVPEKGQTVLLEALAMLSARGPSFRAKIVGGGPTREALERLAQRLGLEGQVSFTGAVGQDQITDCYSAASIFCLPSFAEGLPGVIFEAMAMELPVVATRVMAIPELVEHERTGYLVAPGRADELADAIQRLLEEPQRWPAMGRAGRAKVVRDHNPQSLGEHMDRLFTEKVWLETKRLAR